MLIADSVHAVILIVMFQLPQTGEPLGTMPVVSGPASDREEVLVPAFIDGAVLAVLECLVVGSLLRVDLVVFAEGLVIDPVSGALKLRQVLLPFELPLFEVLQHPVRSLLLTHHVVALATHHLVVLRRFVQSLGDPTH